MPILDAAGQEDLLKQLNAALYPGDPKSKRPLPPNTVIVKPPLIRPPVRLNPSRPVYYMSAKTPIPALMTRCRKSFEKAALRGNCIIEIKAAGKAISKCMRVAARCKENGWDVKVWTEETESHCDLVEVDSDGEGVGERRERYWVNCLVLTVTEQGLMEQYEKKTGKGKKVEKK